MKPAPGYTLIIEDQKESLNDGSILKESGFEIDEKTGIVKEVTE